MPSQEYATTEFSPVDQTWQPPSGKRFNSDFISEDSAEHASQTMLTANMAGRVACLVIELPPDILARRSSFRSRGHYQPLGYMPALPKGKELEYHNDGSESFKTGYISSDELQKIQKENAEHTFGDIWFNGQMLLDFQDDEYYRQKYLKGVREDLRTASATDPSYDAMLKYSDTELADWVKGFMVSSKEAQEAKRPEFEKIKTDFTAQVCDAITTKGLPLSREQVEQRLKDVNFALFPGAINSNLGGDYILESKKVRVNDLKNATEFKRTVYHELFHALQGNRVKRSADGTPGINEAHKFGLETPGSKRKALNEAVTDRLTDIFTDPELYAQYDFNSVSQSLFGANPSRDSSIGSYQSEKAAYNNAFSKMGTKQLLAAYFKGDYDSLEADKLAGSHAERELQRAIKSTGGFERVKELRVIDNDFSRNNYEDAGVEGRRIWREDHTALSGIKRWLNKINVKQHTRHRNRQIAKVKKHIVGVE